MITEPRHRTGSATPLSKNFALTTGCYLPFWVNDRLSSNYDSTCCQLALVRPYSLTGYFYSTDKEISYWGW